MGGDGADRIDDRQVGLGDLGDFIADLGHADDADGTDDDQKSDTHGDNRHDFLTNADPPKKSAADGAAQYWLVHWSLHEAERF